MEKRYLFLYLDTGAGHISTAKILKSAIEKNYPNDKVFLLNGFHKNQIIAKSIFEKGYRASCNFLPGAYSLAFELQKSRFTIDTLKHTFSLQSAHHIQKKIQEYGITDVVNFHFLLTYPAKLAIRKCNKTIPLSVVVSDPFSAPTIWFHFRDVHYLVSSQQAKTIALKQKVPERYIHLMPLIINEKFAFPYTQNEVSSLRKKHGIHPTKKMILLVGGGEGLPGAIEIIKEAIKHQSEFGIIMVCGRDKVTYKLLETLQKAHPHLDLHLYGFVTYLDELIKVCDCAVIKAGPATLLEIVLSKKPVIICKYMPQEIGNVHFATNNKIGWFIQNPKEIYTKIHALFSDESYYNKIQQNMKSLSLDTDITRICNYLKSR
ncbi:MAG: hypothetical protein E7062_02490 [Spirochaetaceae bacterium]|nr:hypothetical protein [Spirochaetaceae bacterium]